MEVLISQLLKKMADCADLDTQCLQGTLNSQNTYLNAVIISKYLLYDLSPLKMMKKLSLVLLLCIVFYSKRHPYIPLDVSNG